MFDIGFWEIALIAVVALLVVGPEEFPRLVRTIGAVLAKIRRFVQDAKRELDREVLQAEELKRLMEEEARIAELHEVAEELNSTIPVNVPAEKKQVRPRTGAGPQDAAAPEARRISESTNGPETTETGTRAAADARTESEIESKFGAELRTGRQPTAAQRHELDSMGSDEHTAVKRRDDGAAKEISS